MPPTLLERRFRPAADFEVRADGAERPRLVGHAAVFNTEAVIAGLWREKVAPGAFRKTIQEADVRALWNHDPNIVLGRNKAGTLALAEDEQGLKIEVEPPDNEWGRPVVDAIKRGDVSQMSISFRVVKQQWALPTDRSELPLRTILEMRLVDVSPVTFPAFEATDIAARAAVPTDDGGAGESDTFSPDPIDEARRYLRCAERGMPLSGEQRAAIHRAADLLTACLPSEPDAPGADHSAAAPGEPALGHSLDAYRRRLRLAEAAA